MTTGACSYLGHENQDTFFSPTQRHLVMFEILQNIEYGSKKRAQVGIEKCIHDEVFEAAYPLHEVRPLFSRSDLQVKLMLRCSSLIWCSQKGAPCDRVRTKCPTTRITRS